MLWNMLPNWAQRLWRQVDQRVKKLLLMCVSISIIYFGMVLGQAFTHFIYAFSIGSLATAYFLFPEEFDTWFNEHEPKFLGAAVGFLLEHGLLGVLIGAWIGYYLQNKYNQACRQVNNARNMAHPILHPIETAQNCCRWGYNYVKSFFVREQPNNNAEPTSQSQPQPQPSRQTNQITSDEIITNGIGGAAAITPLFQQNRNRTNETQSPDPSPNNHYSPSPA